MKTKTPFILIALLPNMALGANSWLWEDSNENQNMSWSGSGIVSGGDTTLDGDGDQDYIISGITTAGGIFRINEIGGYHQGSNSAYPTLTHPFTGGASMQILVNGDPGAEVDFTVDLIGTVANPNTYRSIFDIAPNQFVTSVEIRTLFDGERIATTPDGGGSYQSFALSWVNAATIGEAMTVNTEVTGISINGGNLSNPTTGGITLFGRTAGTLLNITGNTYSAEVDGTQNQNNHGIWSLEDDTGNGTFRGLNVTFTPEDGQFDGSGYFRYTFDGATQNAIPESSSTILICLAVLMSLGFRHRK